jgi:2'-5' RNA ligase
VTDDEVEALLTELEAALQDDVRAALALTADEFVAALDGATELTAARFSVSGIRDMWRRRVGPLMDRLRGVTGRAAEAVADDLGTELPDGWDEPLTAYVEATEALLTAVGDRLAAEATEALAQGLNAGESVDELKDRLAAVFAADGAQLGEGRAARIAMTEATRAWNAGTLAAAQALTGPDRPLVKQWLTRNDERVRAAHREVNGQLQLLDDPFDVAGTPMLYPGDPTAPAALTVGCRCILRTATAPERTASMGEVADVLEEMAAAAEVHTGAMIALVPTDADAARLALEGGEVAEQLHTTLFVLGKAADWTDEQRGDLISRIARAATYLEPINARIFGAAQWNPTSDEPAWVWSIGNDSENDSGPYGQLESARYEATYALEDGHDDPQLPPQHTPWVAHITAAYSSDDWRERMQVHVGPVTFDRIRVAFGGQNTDIPLSGAAIYADDFDEPVAEPTENVMEPAPLVAAWTTPGDDALAFENQQTGDGRVFAPGALYWEQGPWPLQYADEMNGGHAGARLAGAIFAMDRIDGRIPGDGVLYLNTSAGVEAAMLLAQGAPLGVSVDLDDVSAEIVDASAEAESAYAVHLTTASMTPLADGGWHLTGETAVEWTASGSGVFGESTNVDIVVGPDGRIPASAFEVTAAAGDAGDGGVVVERQLSGEVIMRVIRARVRGATLVTIPAYDRAKITLDDVSMFASEMPDAVTAAARNTSPYERVVRHVRKSLIPVTAGEAARFLRVPVSDVRRYLARAAKKGTVVRIAHGRYVPATQAAAETAAAAATPVAPDAADELDLVASAGDAFEASAFEALGEDMAEEIEASAWAALSDLPSMPAAWFAEPTDEELPPGGPGVNYAAGRIFGWVAQAGEPHAGFAKKITVDSLGRIDLHRFLRQPFTLDDGSTVKAGAFTMNVGHHRDGAECETASCQFDDTRTVAGIVTVGMNARGMWFSGAAAPWLSEWDRSVFMATQPSYHMRKGESGNWQLRAVLAVPVPGHASPLMASAVVERSNVALTAAATMAEVEAAVAAATAVAPHDVAAVAPEAEGIDYDRLADSLVAAMARADERKAAEAAELEALMAEAAAIELP